VPLADIVFQPISVLVADSRQMQSQLLTGALRRRPDFKVTACEMDTDAILRMLLTARVDVILLNPSQHDEACFAGARRLHLTHPKILIIPLGEFYGREVVVNAFRSGVRGIFCFAETSLREFCKCIHRVRDGQVWASSEQIHYLLDLVCQVPSLRVISDWGRSLLTPREEQVVALVSEGLSNRDVSRELSLSEHTVKKYLFRIFDKLGVSNRVELVLYAVNHGDTRHGQWVPGISASTNNKRWRHGRPRPCVPLALPTATCECASVVRTLQ
jgi:DNA-binding NarL/FixJ family response regulator